MVPSGNDAALTLALAVSGSESDFVSRMNAAADELGLAETDYVDPIGLSAGNVSSARDLVDLATELREQDLFREIVDTAADHAALGGRADPHREPQRPGPRGAVHRRDQDRDDAGGRLRPGRVGHARRASGSSRSSSARRTRRRATRRRSSSSTTASRSTTSARSSSGASDWASCRSPRRRPPPARGRDELDGGRPRGSEGRVSSSPEIAPVTAPVAEGDAVGVGGRAPRRPEGGRRWTRSRRAPSRPRRADGDGARACPPGRGSCSAARC